MTLTLEAYPMTHFVPNTEMLICVPSRASALLQFRRHIINRLALAILADQRLEYVTAPRLSTDMTRPPQDAPVFGPRPDVYDVRVEPLGFQLPHAEFETDPLRLVVNAHPALLPSTSARLTLMEFQGRWKYEGFKLTSPEPIYQYQPERFQFRRRHGLSGDVIYMLSCLLEPHFWEIEQAFT